MTELRGITWDHPRGYESLAASSVGYSNRYGISVHWDKRSLQAFADEPIEALAETYDLIVLDHPHVGKIAETGALVPLDMPHDAPASSLGGSLESYIWHDRLWALPIDAACQMAVMQKGYDRLPLACWEDVFSLPSSGPRPLTPLLAIDAFDMLMTLVAGRTETTLPYSPDEFVSETNGLVALRVLQALYRLGPSEAVYWNPIDVLETLSTTTDFAYSPCLFGYINYSKPGFRKQTLKYANLPSFEDYPISRGILGGAGIGVSSRSALSDEARKFAAWIASEPVQSSIYLEHEGQPAHRRTWDRMGNDPRYAGFLQGGFSSMDNAWTRPRANWFLDFADDICEVFPDFFLKDLPPSTMLDTINSLYRKYSAKGLNS